jgi:hypothetical protein
MTRLAMEIESLDATYARKVINKRLTRHLRTIDKRLTRHLRTLKL